MLKRSSEKLGFQGKAPAADPTRLLRMTGFNNLDDATLLGALLDMKAHMLQDGNMEDLHNKGCEALRLIAARKGSS
ncbi:conjugal transfer protein TraD [Magnetovibrio sp. PR-2]|uniref:conjugal transfer protein TraD n=1 Tax=Magnetovibrio sp. PR-2 TaxID=3120356 RepID=UPI002FCE2736